MEVSRHGSVKLELYNYRNKGIWKEFMSACHQAENNTYGYHIWNRDRNSRLRLKNKKVFSQTDLIVA